MCTAELLKAGADVILFDAGGALNFYGMYEIVKDLFQESVY